MKMIPGKFTCLCLFVCLFICVHMCESEMRGKGKMCFNGNKDTEFAFGGNKFMYCIFMK